MSKILEFVQSMSSFRTRGKGFEKGVEGRSEEDLVKKFFSDDSETTFKIGDKVKKATDEPGDAQEKGRKGVIMGALYEPESKLSDEYYMVQFAGDEAVTMTLLYKIEADE